MNKKFITVDQAKYILPDSEYVHTFYNTGFGLVGADWEKEEIIQKIENSNFLELTGEVAKRMGHGLCAYDKNTKDHSSILFIETENKRLEEIENKEK